MGELINKRKIKLELQTFITICVVVFGLGVTWASLRSTQTQILVKLDELAVQQEAMIVIRDKQHEELTKQVGRLMPTMDLVLKKIGL